MNPLSPTARLTAAFALSTACASPGIVYEDAAPPPAPRDAAIAVDTMPRDVAPVIVRTAVPPPTISGGTLIVARDRRTAIASDPDRDMVWFVDLASATVLGQLALAPGDEPGRLVDDASGQVHVVLRRGGGIADIDVVAHTLRSRRAVCPTPRGIAFDPASGTLVVACMGGELVTLPAAGGAAVRTQQLDDDLRDVIVADGVSYISRFRTAELLTVSADGTVTRLASPSVPVAGGDALNRNAVAAPHIAWRTIALPDGGVAMLHQRAITSVLRGVASYYGSSGPCNRGIVTTALTVMHPPAVPVAGPTLAALNLGVDVAIGSNPLVLAIVSPGGGRRLELLPLAQIATDPCATGAPAMVQPTGQPIAVAFDGIGRVIVQNREPPSIEILAPNGTMVSTIPLPGGSRFDTGHELFHRETEALIACASCHPEAGDDGHAWAFATVGARRTPQLRGGILATAPFHWNGDLRDFGALTHAVYTLRMGGHELAPEESAALGGYVDAQPLVTDSTAVDPLQVARGDTLFHDTTVGCAGCHSGPKFTNNATVDVGTGGMFQVPPLMNLRWRPPFMHDGCAPTLRERFTPACGGDRHGTTSQLTDAEIADLIAYLRTI